MRLFVAIDLPEHAKQAIVREQKRIASALRDGRASLRWLKPDQIHLTLVFLGDVSEEGAPAVIETIGRHVAMRPFELTFAGLGVFPARGAPRVLWIGVTDGALQVAALQREIAQRITALKRPLESRPFHPHLTLARWRESRPADRRNVLAVEHGGAIAVIDVDAAILYHSRLSAAGPAYTALARANLIGN